MEIGRKIHRFKSCSSTNDLARKLAEGQAEQGEVVVCDEQTKGKGTQRKKWYSIPGKGLYFSVILYPSRSDLSLLPLTASLAVKDMVSDELNTEISLKWPNDLMHETKKIGGILCESSFSGKKLNHSIIGVGINVKHTEQDFPEELRENAGSLEMFYQSPVDKEKLLFTCFHFLDKWYKEFLERDDQKILNNYLKTSYFRPGERVKVEARGNKVNKGEGIFIGLDKKGRVILDIQGKEERFLSGEIHIL